MIPLKEFIQLVFKAGEAMLEVKKRGIKAYAKANESPFKEAVFESHKAFLQV